MYFDFIKTDYSTILVHCSQAAMDDMLLNAL